MLFQFEKAHHSKFCIAAEKEISGKGDGMAGQSAETTARYTTIKVRLYPTPEQAGLFEKTFGCCRWLWNRMLADQQRFYLETGAHFIPTPAKYKTAAPFLKDVDNQALIQEHNRLSQAFRAFFKNPDAFGHPRFKRKKDGRDSFTACNHVFSSGPTIYTTRDGIRMTKAGIVPARFHRRPLGWWKLKRITVERTPTGKYFCSILYACEVQRPGPVPVTPERTLGLQYSLKHFYAADDGTLADPPRWLVQSQNRLAELQRRMSRMKPGSGNYREAVRKYRLLHEHIANQRRDFVHKESRRIANAWDAVCMRADNLNDMKTAFGGPLGSGYGMFRECLGRKLEDQGKRLILVDRYAPSARTCSVCGAAWDASEQRWTCPACGTVHRREVNAARNIKAQGLARCRLSAFSGEAQRGADSPSSSNCRPEHR